MDKRLSSQSFLGAQSEEILTNCEVAIIGLGGAGSPLAQQLAHLGVGRFLLFDHDRVEHKNLNRLIGATREDAVNGILKTAVATRLIRGINPNATVVAVAKQWQEAARSLRSCTVIFGAVDSFAARQEIEATARRYLIPYLDIGMDVHDLGNGFAIGGQVILSMPGELCMRCIGFLGDDLIGREAAEYGAAGDRPQVVWPNGVLASLAVGLFVMLVTPWHNRQVRSAYLEYDGNAQTVATSNKMAYLKHVTCPHFCRAEDFGDPFWSGPANSTDFR